MCHSSLPSRLSTTISLCESDSGGGVTLSQSRGSSQSGLYDGIKATPRNTGLLDGGALCLCIPPASPHSWGQKCSFSAQRARISVGQRSARPNVASPDFPLYPRRCRFPRCLYPFFEQAGGGYFSSRCEITLPFFQF